MSILKTARCSRTFAGGGNSIEAKGCGKLEKNSRMVGGEGKRGYDEDLEGF